jgi:hypothetical protein
MLHWALAQHPDLWGSAESEFMAPVADAAEQAFKDGTRYGEFSWLIKEKVNKPEFLSSIGAGIDQLYRSRSGGRRWLDKTPSYIFHYKTLRSMFPGARFLNIVRDGRFVVDSMQRKFGWSFGKSLISWRSHASAGSAILADQPRDFLQIRYESIVRNPERTLNEIYQFIGENFHPDSVHFAQTPVNTSPGLEDEAPLEKINPERLNWGAARVNGFRIVCGKVQRSMGYPVD